MSANNMYKIGDCVYFESATNAPLQIRRIDELNKTAAGAVEARVTCYFRRCDIPAIAFTTIKRPHLDTDNASIAALGLNTHDIPPSVNGTAATSSPSPPSDQVTATRHAIRQREVFLSRQVEQLPATHIRGKCCITLFNDVEPLVNYLGRDDAFFYRLVYDPVNMTLTEDRGTIRIGSDFQCDIQPYLGDSSKDPRMTANLAELRWDHLQSARIEPHFDMLCLLTKATGTYGRAHDPQSHVREPLLLASVANAGRDISLQHSHDVMHNADYVAVEALNLLLPDGKPVVLKDQFELWSPAECSLFEEGVEKFKKAFHKVKRELMPWKCCKALVEYYYFWKTSDRYVGHRKGKQAALESKLKQVYIPSFSKPNATVLYQGHDHPPCKGCKAQTSSQWFISFSCSSNSRLCTSCWNYWKHYAGLKTPDEKSRDVTVESTPPPPKPTSSEENAVSVETEQPSSAATGTESTPTSNDVSTKPVVVPFFPEGTPNSSVQTPIVPSAASATVPARPPLRSTQCFITPAFFRMARVVCCPKFVRPMRMARRPNKPAKASGTMADYPDDAFGPNALPFIDQFKAKAASKIAGLTNASDVLKRSRDPMPKIDDIIDKIVAHRSKAAIGSRGGAAKRSEPDDASVSLNGSAASPPPAKKTKLVDDSNGHTPTATSTSSPAAIAMTE